MLNLIRAGQVFGALADWLGYYERHTGMSMKTSKFCNQEGKTAQKDQVTAEELVSE